MAKKLLFLITQGELGGAQRYVFDLSSSLPKNQFEVIVAQGPEDLSLKKRLDQIEVKTMVIPDLVRKISPLRDLRAAKQIAAIIKKEKPEIVHTNSTKAGLLGSWVAHKLKVPKVIFTAHGWVFNEPRLLKPFYLLAEKFGARHKTKIICVSEYDRQEAIKYSVGKEDQLVTIHNGVKPYHATQIVNQGPREQQRLRLSKIMGENISYDDIIVGTIAHDYKTKDLPTLRRAAEIAKKQNPKIKLIIIGRGSKIGILPQAADFLPAFDIYVMSSVKEGLPYALLEAISVGLPVVATAVGGITDIIRGGQEGILVQPKDHLALAQALLDLSKNDLLRKQMGQASAKRSRDFSLEQMIQKTQVVYLGN